MTVSPQRPQDGNHQPSVGGNGVRSDETLDSQALPPTLFKLPNLNTEAPKPVMCSAQRAAAELAMDLKALLQVAVPLVRSPSGEYLWLRCVEMMSGQMHFRKSAPPSGSSDDLLLHRRR